MTEENAKKVVELMATKKNLDDFLDRIQKSYKAELVFYITENDHRYFVSKRDDESEFILDILEEGIRKRIKSINNQIDKL